MTKTYEPLLALSLAAAAALLAGCGGGGGGNDDPAPVLDTTQLQGRWVTGAGAAKAYTAVVLPGGAGSGAANAWLLAQDASRLVKLTIKNDGSAAGSAYALSQGGARQAVSGTATAALTASPKTITVNDAVSGATQFSQTDVMATPAVQADATGAWTATVGGQAATLSWTVSGTGAVTGSSTTGCSYAGQITALATASAYNVQASESCPDGSKTTYNGIATLSAAKSALTAVVTSANDAQGAALFFSK